MKKTHKILVLLLIIAGIILSMYGCYYYRIVPKLQDEYTRAGVNEDMQAAFDECRQSIPNMMTKHNIPGVSMAVVDRNGVLWAAGFGYTDYGRKKPVTTETIFLLCSMSKTFTATAVMCAVQDGLVDLDAPITEYLPDFTVNSRFEDNPQDKITLRNLLNHTSGLDHETTVGNVLEPKGVSFEDHIDSISNTWLKHKVGKRWSYSGIGYDLAGYILQIRSGRPFAEYMKEKIFEPLKMPNTSLDPTFIKNHDNRAIGHWKHFKKVPLEIPVPAAAGVYCSTKELARFVQFHLNYGRLDGQTILSENLVKQMYTPSPTSRRYGLGVDYYGKRGRGHGGTGYGFGSVMVWAPDYGIGGLILINEEDPDNNRGQHWEQVYNVLRKLLDNEIVEKTDSFIEHASEIEPVAYQLPDPSSFTPYKPAWKKYVGTYRYITNGRELHIYASIALALGYPHPDTQVRVYEKDGFLEIDGRRLDEHLPGLFFSSDGYCLDFRGPVPTWQNFRMKRK
jgi:CubicO group peptidase (beta-lactamase class C family)